MFLVLIELSITLVGGSFNVSAIVQMSIIMNFKWTSGFNDKVHFLFIFILFYFYFGHESH